MKDIDVFIGGVRRPALTGASLCALVLRGATALALLWISGIVAASESAGGDAQTADRVARIDAAVAPFVAARDFMGVVGYQFDGQAPVILPYAWARSNSTSVTGPMAFSESDRSASRSPLSPCCCSSSTELCRSPIRWSRHLPEFKPNDDIRIEQLLLHTRAWPTSTIWSRSHAPAAPWVALRRSSTNWLHAH